MASPNSHAMEHSVSKRALSRAVRRLRPSTSPSTCHVLALWRKHWHQCPQQARRVLPLSGRLARDRSRLRTADEHAERPRSSRMMLRHHMLIMHVDRVESMKDVDFDACSVHESDFLCVRALVIVVRATLCTTTMHGCVLCVSHALGRGWG